MLNLTNNANVKTLRLRWGGVAGTVLWQQAVTSFAVYATEILIAGRNTGNSLLGAGVTTSASGGWGGSTGAQVALVSDYANQESDIVLTMTKATAGDTAELSLLRAELY